ncbi:MAG: CCA tRNA nucleotidyltransferase [Elusimicrobia bacterium]|nr:CCA tRNA nucleotidyltransferase [Candidatus Liberimonas magnetica]
MRVMNLSRIESGKLKQISRYADKLNKHAYLVGGALRDILLKKKVLDLDIVIEGDAQGLINELSKAWKAKTIVYPEFGTYILKYKKGRHIDFATARKESYPKPGSLPKVTFSNLKDDLYRRDFTINAMALALSGTCKGRIIDYYGGQKDLENRTLRVLHKESFKDDATRLFRLARFMGRGYRPEKNTLKLVKRAVKYLKAIAPERLREELLAILKEKKPFKILSFLKNWGVLRFIIPEARVNRALEKLDKVPGLANRFSIIFSGLSKEERSSAMLNLRLQRSLKNEIERLSQTSKERQLISGKDLIKMGYKPGPIFKEILNNTSKQDFVSRQKALQFVIDNYPGKK